MIIAFSRTLLTVKLGQNVLNFGFRNVGVPIGPPITLKFARSYFIMSPTQMYMRFGFVPRGTSIIPGHLKFGRHYYAFSPTQMFIRFGFTPRGTLAPPPKVLIDTHDGVKKKKKKKQRDFNEEIDRRKKIRKQIEEVVHPTPEILPPLTPDRIPEEVTIIEPLRTYRSLETPVIDYAGLARDEIVAKLKHDAILKARQYQDELHRIELKRIADEEEEEEELMMILGTIL